MNKYFRFTVLAVGLLGLGDVNTLCAASRDVGQMDLKLVPPVLADARFPLTLTLSLRERG
jgi:hypothetical protein